MAHLMYIHVLLKALRPARRGLGSSLNQEEDTALQRYVFMNKLAWVLMLACVSASAQTAGRPGGTLGGAGSVVASVGTADSSQNPYFGSKPTGEVVPGTVDLSLSEALDRGLKQNLGLLLTAQAGEQARAARLRSLSELLPNVNAHVSRTEEQLNLLALSNFLDQPLR